MEFFVLTCLLALSASAKGNGAIDLGPIYAPRHASADYYSYPSYAFEYSVKDPHTGDNKAQWEKRDGDAVKGAYSLVEPDGSLRVVEYWADDKSGFNAIVKRLGPNLHPTGPTIAPYKANIPILTSPHPVPISVGPVAQLGGLAGAPLLHGPIYGGDISPALAGASLLAKPIHGNAVSSATIYKAPPALKTIAPPLLHETILPAPIIKERIVPLEHEPILSYPIIKSAPNYHAPIPPAPVLPAPIIKPGLILRDYPYSSLLKEPYVGRSYNRGPVLEPFYEKSPVLKSPYIKDSLYEPGLIKAPLFEPIIATGPLPYDSLYDRGLLRQDVLDKAPLLSWENLGYGKH
ncbi:pupal cuticle protein Edg-84A-like [Hyposmocoma kahamanoa]|uniref:pupal cuticle protein Edg-84A-like n=1 Tax=Hyposmocoma kahamanoa TaxID=1477025 RepID=UPI000E6D835B|nr:pupal cuticle protein Edg-84A-like [Hyposmocoma kahamanoa]